MLGFDGHVYDAIVSEQPELTVCQVIREVVNVDQEQDGAQDCSLRKYCVTKEKQPIKHNVHPP
jgi:hypothetical protein